MSDRTKTTGRARSWAEINLHRLGGGAKFVRYRIDDERSVEYWVAGSRGSWEIRRRLETRPVPGTPCGREILDERDLAPAGSLREVRETIAADLAVTS